MFRDKFIFTVVFISLMFCGCGKCQHARGKIQSLAISDDGKWLVSAFEVQEKACLWDIETSKVIRRFDIDGGVLSLAMTEDKRRLIALSASDINVMELETGKQLSKCEIRKVDKPLAWSTVACNVDDNRVFYCSGTEAFCLDLPNCKEVGRFQGHTKAVRCIVLSRDGNVLATASDDHSVRIWEAGTGKELRVFDCSKDESDRKSVV